MIEVLLQKSFQKNVEISKGIGGSPPLQKVPLGPKDFSGPAFRLHFSDGHVGHFPVPQPQQSMWSRQLQHQKRITWGGSATEASNIQEESGRNPWIVWIKHLGCLWGKWLDDFGGFFQIFS